MRRMYQFLWMLTWPFVSLFYPHRHYGRDNLPAGTALVCGNHSSMLDPLLITYACGKAHPLHFMAKAEIMRVPVVGFLLKKAGIFAVDRGAGGASAIKTAMRYLKAGEKVAIFPEGTRVRSEEDSEAKLGAVRLSVRMGVPLVPVYLPRKKRIFRVTPVVIGEAYHPDLGGATAKTADYTALAAELMERIRALEEAIR